MIYPVVKEVVVMSKNKGGRSRNLFKLIHTTSKQKAVNPEEEKAGFYSKVIYSLPPTPKGHEISNYEIGTCNIKGLGHRPIMIVFMKSGVHYGIDIFSKDKYTLELDAFIPIGFKGSLQWLIDHKDSMLEMSKMMLSYSAYLDTKDEIDNLLQSI